jgi:apolipoprotein N-acyltransferase
LAGTIDIDPEPPHVHYNCAMLVRPDGSAEPSYRKRHLVPFGEFVPLEKRLPILRKLTPIQASFGRGKGAQIVTLDPGVKLGVLICFEDVFPYLARDAVQDGANLLINVTNDGWFKQSDAQIQHAAAAVFRAVENRVPLARACNNGYSCVIEATGRIAADIRDPERGIYVPGVTAAGIALPTSPAPPTFYNRYGDVFAVSCLAAACVVWILGFLDFLSTRKAAKAQRLG